jgi:GR25 family glycosyltransferase involved in LPS biosynthesis
MLNNIKDITHSFFINLNHRTDRKQHVEKQLHSIGISSPVRFSAIKLPNGAIGCGMSHLRCLEHARDNAWDHVLIVEDDIQFLDPTLFVNQMNLFLHNQKEWDVLLLGGNNVPPYREVDTTCIQVSFCQTTTGYLVKNHYFETLINNIRLGISHLIREPNNRLMYAIDKFWILLQRQDKWFLIVPLTVTQREDYSDIERRPTNYKRAMTSLDKEWMFKKK